MFFLLQDALGKSNLSQGAPPGRVVRSNSDFWGCLVDLSEWNGHQEEMVCWWQAQRLDCLEFHSCHPAIRLDRTAVAGHHLPTAKPAGNLSPGQSCWLVECTGHYGITDNNESVDGHTMKRDSMLTGHITVIVLGQTGLASKLSMRPVTQLCLVASDHQARVDLTFPEIFLDCN